MEQNTEIVNSAHEQDVFESAPPVKESMSRDDDIAQGVEKSPLSRIKKLYPPLVQSAVEVGLIIGGLLYIFLLLPRMLGGDGAIRYQDLLLISSLHKPISKYSAISVIFAYPLMWIGRRFFNQSEIWVDNYNFVIFCIALLAIYLLLRKRIDRSLLRRFLLILTVASMYVAHLSFFYGEVFTSLCVGFGILAVSIRFASPIGWIAIVLGVANTPATLVALAFMMLKKVFDSKHLRYLFVVIAAVACIMLESFIRHGSFFSNGYGNDKGYTTFMPYSGLPGFSYPPVFGLLSLLFSFGKGLIFFVPGLFLPIRKVLLKRQQEQQIDLYQVYTLWLSFVLGLVFVYATWWAWYGGQFWGPRFFLIASIPTSFVLAVRLCYYKDFSVLANIVTLVVFCLSVWIGIDGAVFQWSTTVIKSSICAAPNYQFEMICIYTPEFSPLWYPFVHHIAISTSQILFICYTVLVGVYLIIPVCVHTGKQLVEVIKKYSRIYINLNLWHI